MDLWLLLWFLYNIFHNYGVAIIFFTIIIKAVLFPFSVKSQRSMASQTKLADKQKEMAGKQEKQRPPTSSREGARQPQLRPLTTPPIMLGHLLR